jgi:hypothetical protein
VILYVSIIYAGKAAQSAEFRSRSRFYGCAESEGERGAAAV